MKLKYIITLILVYACNLLTAGNSIITNNSAFQVHTIISTEPSEGNIIDSPSITADDSGMYYEVSDDEDETLDSVLGYFILIFLSVLVIILIDNRNLERRYKKLVADFKTKDSTV
ncbi:MAG: hypothetical protein AAF617_06840 [Bacteroidota bacterium]